MMIDTIIILSQCYVQFDYTYNECASSLLSLLILLCFSLLVTVASLHWLREALDRTDS